jgi:hypothetical protein
MGGQALKNCVTRRYDAEEYYALEKEVLKRLKSLFPESQPLAIKAYSAKESFGDMDVLIDSELLPSSWVKDVCECFSPKEFIKNGNVLSFEFRECQVDLIVTDPSEMHSSYNYFAYNDLGNLIGRVAHSMGLKLGHDGLTYKFYAQERHVFREIKLLDDWEQILPVLGYSWERYQQGFDTLEDIFEFVVSSPFFNKSIYALENRNHAARTRDQKRKTYMEFLKWIESYDETNTQNALKFRSKENWLGYLFDIVPNFRQQYELTQYEYDDSVEFKSRFNGTLVTQWTGIEKQELGSFMKWFKAYYGEDKIKRDVLKMNPDLVQGWVEHFVEKWKREE